MAPFVDPLLRSVGSVLFTARRRSGLLFLLAILLAPRHGLGGLLGALAGIGTGRLLAKGSAQEQLGFFGGAGLLAGLALAAYLPVDPRLWLLAPVAGFLAALLLIGLAPSFARRDLPTLALPFVLAAWLLLAATPWLGLGPVAAQSPDWIWPVLGAAERFLGALLPGWSQDLLRSFGSLLFLPGLTTGAIVLAGLLAGSRVTSLAMVAGGLVGTALLRAAGGELGPAEFGLVAFNAILVAAAMTGIFVAITPGGLLWALGAVTASTLLSAALHPLLEPFGLPVLALPFTLAVWLFLLPLKPGLGLPGAGGIWAPPLALIGRAEDNLRAFERWQRERRQPLPVLSLPLRGVWTVTQGPKGALTHNTATGSEAWDFMLLDEGGSGAEWPGSELDQFHGYGMPVLAPAEGRVVAVEGSLPDNAVHAADTRHPWGNWVMVAHESGAATLLAHLRAGSLRVLPGQAVTRGQELAQVGNSGRSPEPHLHVQLNATPWLAAPSLPARFGSWVELAEDGPVFHPLGRPEEGMRVATLTALDWPEHAACYPLAVPGRRWSWRVSGPFGSGERTVELRAGQWGRLILDDGRCASRVVWWPGWVQLVPLLEGDPDGRGPARRDSLVALLTLLAPALPLNAPDGLAVAETLRSPLLARGLRRLLTLEDDAPLEMRMSAVDGGGVEWSCRVLDGPRERWSARLSCEPRRGFRRFRVERGGRLWLDAERIDEPDADAFGAGLEPNGTLEGGTR